MQRPRVIIVGGMEFNIPDELKQRFEVVKHLEQKVNRVDRVPECDYIFVISDFVSHTMVNVVKHMARVPVVYLARGWAHMKTELERRSILPPESPEAAGEPARQSETEEPKKEQPPASGLSNEKLWELYGDKVVQAVKGTLKPKELVDEDVLLEIVGDLVGIPAEELRGLRPKNGPDVLLDWLTMTGILLMPKDKVYCLMIGDDGFAWGKNMPEEEPLSTGRRGTRRHRPAGESEERVKKICGLRMGPYISIAELAREMLKYEEFHNEGRPLSMEYLRRLIKRAAELKIVDDTHQKIYVDNKPEIVLKKIATPVPEELLPVSQPELSEEGKLEKAWEEMPRRPADITKETAESYWRDVVDRVKGQKRHIATMLENSRIEWMAQKEIICCLIPQEYSIWMRQLDSTENWGLISSIVRERFGMSVVVRFMLDNSVSKGKA